MLAAYRGIELGPTCLVGRGMKEGGIYKI
jgi:hypothetical protein